MMPDHASQAPTQNDEGLVDFSIVLPMYNEEGNLHELHRRLTKVLRDELEMSYELLFVDDGSQDQTWPLLQALQEQDDCVRVLKFARNFGHHIAVTAGIDHTRGEYVVLMDSDLQDQPEEIPKLFHKMQEGYDVVYAVRRNKKFSWIKRTNSQLFRWVMRKLIHYEIQGGIFRMLRRQVVEKVRQCRETDRLVIGLINWVGFRQTGVDVEHGARTAGVTKYSLRKQLQLAMNSLTAFSTMPLRLASWFGFFIGVLSFSGILWLFARKLLFGIPVMGWTSLMVTISFLGGVQLLCLGILGEYIARIFTETRKRPLYIIETHLDTPPLPASPPQDDTTA